MTTKEAAQLYAAQHAASMRGKGYAIFNPQNKALEELPVIYGFNNGGREGWLSAQLMAEDGTPLGSHVCSAEAYMPHDLGILEGTRPDRHTEQFQKHYPAGYRMEFVAFEDIKFHEKLMAAINIANSKVAKDSDNDKAQNS